jgi:hypothetical protein
MTGGSRLHSDWRVQVTAREILRGAGQPLIGSNYRVVAAGLGRFLHQSTGLALREDAQRFLNVSLMPELSTKFT